MPKKNHRPEEIIGILRETDILISQSRKKVVEVIKALGVNNATYYRWKQEYEGMPAPEDKRLKELEVENEMLRIDLMHYRATTEELRTKLEDENAMLQTKLANLARENEMIQVKIMHCEAHIDASRRKPANGKT